MLNFSQDSNVQEEYLPDICEFAKWFARQDTSESKSFTKLLARAWKIIEDAMWNAKSMGSFYTEELGVQVYKILHNLKFIS